MGEAQRAPVPADEQHWRAADPDIQHRPKLVLLEDDQVLPPDQPPSQSPEYQPVPDTVINNRQIAHRAAISEQESREHQQMAEARGSDIMSIQETRDMIETSTSAQDKTVTLISEVIYDKMLQQADRVNKNRHLGAQQRPEGSPLVQPDRIPTMLQEEAYRRDYVAKFPEGCEAAKSILGNAEASELARAEGVSKYYEIMTGVPATDMKFAFQRANEALQALKKAAGNEETKWAVRNPLYEKSRGLSDRVERLQNVKELTTNLPEANKSKYSVPSVLAPHESFVKYYIQGVPEGTMSAQDFLAEAGNIESEAREILETPPAPAEEPLASEGDAVPAEGSEVGFQKPKTRQNLLARLFGPRTDRPVKPTYRPDHTRPQRPSRPIRREDQRPERPSRPVQ